MISFDYLTLKAFYTENKDFFSGARLQKIHQPTRRDFLFSIRNKGETKKLYINIDPQVYHLCFPSEANVEKRCITIPSKPPMFCMLLRKYLEGFRIINVNVPEYERIFEIYFESYNELNEKVILCLAIEFMGKYSNVILYNTDNNIIIGCAHNVGSEKSRDRELAGTLPYTYPKKQAKVNIANYNGKLDYKYLNTCFLGISIAFQNQLSSKSVPLDIIKKLVSQNYPLSPAYNKDEFSIYSELIDAPSVVDTVNEMVDNYFSLQQEKLIFKALKLKLKNIVYPLCKRQKLSLEKLSAQLIKKDNSSKYKDYADLIMANLYNNSDYSKQITADIWSEREILVNDDTKREYFARKITIPLDNKMTLKENAQKYYLLYSKSKNAVEKLERLKSETKAAADYYESILYSINNSDTIKELYEIHSECEDACIIKTNNVKSVQKTLNVEEININGYKIYIGKNNKQNDKIISKIASPNDIWFHVKNNTGSHVLLSLPDNTSPDESIIYECAKLAKKYSTASLDKKAGVIYTKRKYLKKPPKANLGYVTYKNEKEIYVE